MASQESRIAARMTLRHDGHHWEVPMPRSQTKRTRHFSHFAVVAFIGLSIAWATGAGASPEDEIARLNRVRANLFEELVKTRAEAAAARAELDAAIKGREAAEAELARLKQEAAGVKPTNPVPSVEANVAPQEGATNAASRASRGQSVRPAAPGGTGSIQRTVTAGAQQHVARTNRAKRAVARQADQAPRQLVAPDTRAQDLPSVLRLQD
jgi:hypothetical protein